MPWSAARGPCGQAKRDWLSIWAGLGLRWCGRDALTHLPSSRCALRAASRRTVLTHNEGEFGAFFRSAGQSVSRLDAGRARRASRAARCAESADRSFVAPPGALRHHQCPGRFPPPARAWLAGDRRLWPRAWHPSSNPAAAWLHGDRQSLGAGSSPRTCRRCCPRSSTGERRKEKRCRHQAAERGDLPALLDIIILCRQHAITFEIEPRTREQPKPVRQRLHGGRPMLRRVRPERDRRASSGSFNERARMTCLS